jgi:hypothetical protein
VGSPGTAKNVLTVGSSKNVQDGTDRLSWFSSKGPTPDGRFKPDVVAVGEIHSANSSGVIGDLNCGTVWKPGTSMATPIVAGTAALLRQYIVEGRLMDGITPTWVPAPFQPTAALLKALLMHGARQVQHQEDCQGSRWQRFTRQDGTKGFRCYTYRTHFKLEDHFPNFGATLKLLCVYIHIYTYTYTYIHIYHDTYIYIILYGWNILYVCIEYMYIFIHTVLNICTYSYTHIHDTHAMTFECRVFDPIADQYLFSHAAVGFGSVDMSYLPVGAALTGAAACQPPVSINDNVLRLEAHVNAVMLLADLCPSPYSSLARD